MVQSQKFIKRSNALQRDFHADLFVIGDQPELLFLMFGGSGIDHKEYRERQETIVPIFNNALKRLESEFSFFFCYITSPYDIPYNNFNNIDFDTEKWNSHVEHELLPDLPDLPLYYIGYSGGVALMFHGLHMLARCFGAGALGADALPADFELPNWWREPATLYYNLSDLLYYKNCKTIKRLEEEMAILCLRRLTGGHDLKDYIANESFGGLIRRARKLLRCL